MPTIPSHQARDTAESFGADAARYDRARPGYPQALTSRILAASPGRDVLDVGIGTGIAARAFRNAGCRVLGVEADPRMAEFARRSGFQVEVARFEEWAPAGRGFDLVVAGQAWHWVDPVAGARRAAEVLRPGGRLAAFWNVMRFSPDVAAAFAEVYARVLSGSPYAGAMTAGLAAYHGQFGKAEDGIRAAGGFAEPERWRVDWDRSYTRDAWLDAIPTAGRIGDVPPSAVDEVVAGIGEAIDRLGGAITVRYAAVAVTAPLRA